MPFGDVHSIPIFNNNNLQYYSELGIGSGTDQKFNVILDTGSDKLWVPSTHCHSAVCKAHHRFDETRSDSFNPSDDHITLRYGTGSVSARTGEDHINLGSARVDTYPVALTVSQTQKPFSSLSKIDGIFGIGKSTKFAETKPVFSFYLSNDTAKSGNLTLGGLDVKHVDENAPAHAHPVSDPNTWSIDLVDIKVGNHRVGICPDGPCKALIDTGSSLVTGPPTDMQKVLDAGVHETCDGYLHGPSPNVSLIFRDEQGKEVEYPLTSKEYSIDFRDDHKECKLGFGKLDMGPKKWVIGDTFLRRYVSLFDRDNHQVSFVRSRHDDENIGVLTRQLSPQLISQLFSVPDLKVRIRDIGNQFLFN
jgi:cathepsin D